MVSALETRIGISAEDYIAAIAFYGDALGLVIEKSWDRGGVDRGALFRTGAAFIEVLPRAYVRGEWRHNEPGHNELGHTEDTPRGPAVWLYLEVEDVDASHERLQAHGAPILMPPTNEPWGHRRLRTCDPDGTTVGLFSRLSA